jgi:hypothetical protein
VANCFSRKSSERDLFPGVGFAGGFERDDKIPLDRLDGFDGKRRGWGLLAWSLGGALAGVRSGSGRRLISGLGRGLIEEEKVCPRGEQEQNKKPSQHGLGYAHSHLLAKAEVYRAIPEGKEGRGI